MTMANMASVERNDGALEFGAVPVLMVVVGEKAFQTIDSQMLVAMKREIPEPSFLKEPIEEDHDECGGDELDGDPRVGHRDQ
jgi:hypothetical protein